MNLGAPAGPFRAAILEGFVMKILSLSTLAVLAASTLSLQAETPRYGVQGLVNIPLGDLKTYVDKGYILSNQLSVTTYQTNLTGAILKAAVSNGANDVSSVSFGLSDALQQQVYNSLLGQAATQANGKAQAIASAANVSVKKLDSISEGYQTIPYTKTYASNGGVATPAAPAAVVTPGMVSVSASVSAVYEIG